MNAHLRLRVVRNSGHGPCPSHTSSLRVVRNLVSRSPGAPEPRSPDRWRAGAPARPYARAIRSPATSVLRSFGSRLPPRGPDAPIAHAPHRAPDRPYARGPRRPDIPTPITRVQGAGTGRLMRRLVAIRAGENPAGMTAPTVHTVAALPLWVWAASPPLSDSVGLPSSTE